MFPFPRPFWDGHTCSEGLHPDYVNLRKRLFKAAQDADWVAVFAILAEDKQGKAVNGVLLNADSHNSVLHHAAAGNAPLEVVERLIASGAFRSVRCALGSVPST